LWGVSPKTYGGLGLSTQDIGQALAVAGKIIWFNLQLHEITGLMAHILASCSK